MQSFLLDSSCCLSKLQAFKMKGGRICLGTLVTTSDQGAWIHLDFCPSQQKTPKHARRSHLCSVPRHVLVPRFWRLRYFLKEYRNRLNTLQIPDVLTLEEFKQHFHNLVVLCNILCPSGQCGKLISLPCLCFYEPSKPRDNMLQRMAERGNGEIWTEFVKPDLDRKATVPWYYCGSQDLDQWVTLGHTALQLLYNAPFPDLVFQVPNKIPICLEPIHFPHKTQCGHNF
ncbi:hypothetical protein TNCT_26171 [Trichonephila clavata]|uniref:Uncharacterized protein n=1 Tax=Trichonephila clavata TaxID=2740835 RepID=A0A8X6KWX3_TRICU|nr:hypothetical protein TNCT_26171 [Trichonephila clavata]